MNNRWYLIITLWMLLILLFILISSMIGHRDDRSKDR